jgi:transcriptional regulator with XRE-family HTH domain
MKEIGDPRHKVLHRYIRERRRLADLSQETVAERIGRLQTFVSAVERGQHRVGVLEFLDLAEAIGFDPYDALKKVAKGKK